MRCRCSSRSQKCRQRRRDEGADQGVEEVDRLVVEQAAALDGGADDALEQRAKEGCNDDDERAEPRIEAAGSAEGGDDDRRRDAGERALEGDRAVRAARYGPQRRDEEGAPTPQLADLAAGGVGGGGGQGAGERQRED